MLNEIIADCWAHPFCIEILKYVLVELVSTILRFFGKCVKSAKFKSRFRKTNLSQSPFIFAFLSFEK